jgi:hypothetical protein
MTALAAAHDCSLSSRELALLCQKAEVRVALSAYVYLGWASWLHV